MFEMTIKPAIVRWATDWAPMPAIAVRRLDGTVDYVRSFSYADYLCSLS